MARRSRIRARDQCAWLLLLRGQAVPQPAAREPPLHQQLRGGGFLLCEPGPYQHVPLVPAAMLLHACIQPCMRCGTQPCMQERVSPVAESTGSKSSAAADTQTGRQAALLRSPVLSHCAVAHAALPHACRWMSPRLTPLKPSLCSHIAHSALPSSGECFRTAHSCVAPPHACRWNGGCVHVLGSPPPLYLSLPPSPPPSPLIIMLPPAT